MQNWLRGGWVSVCVVLCAASAHAQLRIVTYNVGEWSANRAAMVEASHGAGDLGDIFAAMAQQSVQGIARAPDVIALQEMTASATTGAEIVSVLNSLFGSGTYAVGNLNVATSGGGRPGLVYNTQTVTLLEQRAVGNVSTNGAARQTARYRLRPEGYDESADFYLYVSHFKASPGGDNEDRRNVEATTIRTNADALGQGTHVIYAGDLNLYSGNEPAFDTFLAPGNGQAFDPTGAPANWGTSSSRSLHTQSPVTSGRYASQVTGGLDDRFDFQLPSGEWFDNEGLALIAGSYRTFGNNGTHSFNGNIGGGNGASSLALNALMNTSDHLPVIADYQVPAVMSVDLDLASLPPVVIRGASVSVAGTVHNAANVVAPNGADELDWVAGGTGAVVGMASGTDHALGGVDTFNLLVDTGQAGQVAGTIEVSTSSPQAAHANFSQELSMAVLEHAEPSFAGEQTIDSLSLDFGIVYQGTTSPIRTFEIFNREVLAGLTASMSLVERTIVGDEGIFGDSLAIGSTILPDSMLSLFAGMATDLVGSFAATIELTFMDQPLPGATESSLMLSLTGTVLERLAGDYNFDGVVDAADYTLWRDTLGTTVDVLGGGADGNGNGVVDADDYAVWRANWGATSAALRATAAVPEPASLWLLLGLAVAAAWRAIVGNSVAATSRAPC